MSRESTTSNRTRAASLEKLQTGSIKSKTSLVSRYEVANTVRNEEGNEESSWSDTEDEGEQSSQQGKGLINVIFDQSSKIAKVKESVTLCPGQGNRENGFHYLATVPNRKK